MTVTAMTVAGPLDAVPEVTIQYWFELACRVRAPTCAFAVDSVTGWSAFADIDNFLCSHPATSGG